MSPHPLSSTSTFKPAPRNAVSPMDYPLGTLPKKRSLGSVSFDTPSFSLFGHTIPSLSWTINLLIWGHVAVVAGFATWLLVWWR